MTFKKLAAVIASLTGLASFASLATAASVKEVNTKKKLVDVELDEGETFEKGAAVCFFDDTDKKGECGTVAKVKGTLAQVKVAKPKKVKAGMTMKADAEADQGSGSDSDEEDGKKAKDKKKKKEAATPTKGKNPFRLAGYFGLPLLTPATYNKVAYAAPTVGTVPTTLWTADKKIAAATFGAEVEADIPLGKFALIPGLRYRTFTPSLIDSDYDKGRLNPYVSTEEKATALGVFFDFQYLRLTPAQIIGINLLAGLDVDMSTVTVKVTKKDDSPGGVETPLAKATSKLNVISLRLGANTDILALKIMGARFGLGLMVPLFAAGGSFAGSVDEVRGLESSASDDLKKAINHKKASVAAQINVGGVLAL